MSCTSLTKLIQIRGLILSLKRRFQEISEEYNSKANLFARRLENLDECDVIHINDFIDSFDFN